MSTSFVLQVVNIGSGVSILAVYGPNNFKRVTGTRYGVCYMSVELVKIYSLALEGARF